MKRRWSYFLLCIIFLAVLMNSLSGCGENVLRVGFDPSFEPMSYQEEDGTCRGYFLDIMKEAAHRMGMEFEAVPIWWAELNWNFTENKIDCFIDCQNSEILTNEYLCSKPLLQGANKVLVLANTKYKDVGDFEENEYYLLVRSCSEEGFMLRFPELPMQGCLVSCRTLAIALSRMDEGIGQGVLINRYTGDYVLNKYPDKYRILPAELDASTYGVVFQLGNVELQTKVNAALEEMKADGTLARISEQWFGRDIIKEFT